jgi:hypothetical protein
MDMHKLFMFREYQPGFGGLVDPVKMEQGVGGQWGVDEHEQTVLDAKILDEQTACLVVEVGEGDDLVGCCVGFFGLF